MHKSVIIIHKRFIMRLFVKVLLITVHIIVSYTLQCKIVKYSNYVKYEYVYKFRHYNM